MLAPAQNAPLDRRKTSAEMLALIQQIHENQLALSAALQKHMTEETHELAEAMTSLLASAFPEGDPDGHRVYHEASIQAAKDRAAFWQKMKFEIVKYGLFGFLGWAVVYLWQGFLQGPHK